MIIEFALHWGRWTIKNMYKLCWVMLAREVMEGGRQRMRKGWRFRRGALSVSQSCVQRRSKLHANHGQFESRASFSPNRTESLSAMSTAKAALCTGLESSPGHIRFVWDGVDGTQSLLDIDTRVLIVNADSLGRCRGNRTEAAFKPGQREWDPLLWYAF